MKPHLPQMDCDRKVTFGAVVKESFTKIQISMGAVSRAGVLPLRSPAGALAFSFKKEKKEHDHAS